MYYNFFFDILITYKCVFSCLICWDFQIIFSSYFLAYLILVWKRPLKFFWNLLVYGQSFQIFNTWLKIMCIPQLLGSVTSISIMSILLVVLLSSSISLLHFVLCFVCSLITVTHYNCWFFPSSFVKFFFLYILRSLLLATPHDIWDPSFLTRDWTCIRSTDS